MPSEASISVSVTRLIVNGKYRFDLGTAGGPEQALQVADQLIAKERATLIVK